VKRRAELAPYYSLLSILPNCVNRGNIVIEAATRHILGLEASTLNVNAHSRISSYNLKQINRSKALILPGATLLQPGDHTAVNDLPAVKSPIVALGVALRSRLDLINLKVARCIKLPIGSRDPFTHQALQSHGIESYLVGCQTLLLGRASRWQERKGPILFCPGLGSIQPQEDCIRACANIDRTIVLCHAPAMQMFNSSHPNIDVVALEGLDQALSLIESASMVVTSRIHGFLMSVVKGTPAIFLGGWYDSRYSLLDFLCVPVEPPVPTRIRRMVESVLNGKLPDDRCFPLAERLRTSMCVFLGAIAQPLGLRPNLGAF
jgi:hypothetical protein